MCRSLFQTTQPSNYPSIHEMKSNTNINDPNTNINDPDNDVGKSGI